MARQSLIAENLRREREAKGLTHQHMASLLGIPRSSYTALESGKRRLLAEEAAIIAEHLSVPLKRIVPVKSKAA